MKTKNDNNKLLYAGQMTCQRVNANMLGEDEKQQKMMMMMMMMMMILSNIFLRMHQNTH